MLIDRMVEQRNDHPDDHTMTPTWCQVSQGRCNAIGQGPSHCPMIILGLPLLGQSISEPGLGACGLPLWGNCLQGSQTVRVHKQG